jgi:prepilin-type N-terminal cleavage/methylation domain-containing protein
MSRHRAGFSLVETLMATAISGIIGGALVMVLYQLTQLSTSQNRNMLNQESLRDTAHFIMEEILAMGNGSVEPYIADASAHQLTYIGDMDNDGTPDKVRFTYDTNSGQLTRTLYSTNDNGATWSTVSTDVLLDGMEDCSFTYYAAGNAAATGVTDVTSIKLALQLDPEAHTTAFTTGHISPQNLTTRVTIRNRMLQP